MPHGREAGVVIQYALLAGPLLSMLDSSVVNVAAEPIARSLHASLGAVRWTISGYLLALGTGLLGKSGRARSVSPVAGILLFAAPAFGPTVGRLAVLTIVAHFGNYFICD